MLRRLLGEPRGIKWNHNSLFILRIGNQIVLFHLSSRYPIHLEEIPAFHYCNCNRSKFANHLQSAASLVFCGDFDQNARRSIAARRYDRWQVWQMFLLDLLGWTVVSSTSLLDLLGISATWFLELSSKRYWPGFVVPGFRGQNSGPHKTPVENGEATYSFGSDSGEGIR